MDCRRRKVVGTKVIGARVVEIAFYCEPIAPEIVSARLASITPFVKVVDVPLPYQWGITVGLHALGTKTGYDIVGEVCKSLGIETGTHIAWNDSSERS